MTTRMRWGEPMPYDEWVGGGEYDSDDPDDELTCDSCEVECRRGDMLINELGAWCEDCVDEGFHERD